MRRLASLLLLAGALLTLGACSGNATKPQSRTGMYLSAGAGL